MILFSHTLTSISGIVRMAVLRRKLSEIIIYRLTMSFVDKVVVSPGRLNAVVSNDFGKRNNVLFFRDRC
jgi:hypothetical protein